MKPQAFKTKTVTIAAKDLKIHPIAQRRLVASTLKKITENLDLDSIGVIDAVEDKCSGYRSPSSGVVDWRKASGEPIFQG